MGILVDPIKCFPSHPSEDILEEYVFHRLPEGLAEPIEEHLLACHVCQDVVAETDELVAALKSAASQPSPWWSVLAGLPIRTSLAPITALVILALVVVWKQRPQETPTPVAVSLSSLRGPSPLAPAPARKPLRLSFDLPDLVFSGTYRAEVVDTAGSPVWEGAISGVDGKLTATMSKPLRNGVYWVRLYGADSELLREFGLSAK